MNKKYYDINKIYDIKDFKYNFIIDRERKYRDYEETKKKKKNKRGY